MKNCYEWDAEKDSQLQKQSSGGVFKIGVLKIFTKFTGKHLCQSLRSVILLKKRFWHRCFPVHFAKFLGTPFLIGHLRWLFLQLIKKMFMARSWEHASGSVDVNQLGKKLQMFHTFWTDFLLINDLFNKDITI